MNLIKKIIICFFIIISITNVIYGTDQIIEEELNNLDLSNFISESEKFTKELFKNQDVDIKGLILSAIKGNINNKEIFKNIVILVGKEIVATIKTLASILIIIIIHSILKNISENLSNNNVRKDSILCRIYLNCYIDNDKFF